MIWCKIKSHTRCTRVSHIVACSRANQDKPWALVSKRGSTVVPLGPACEECYSLGVRLCGDYDAFREKCLTQPGFLGTVATARATLQDANRPAFDRIQNGSRAELIVDVSMGEYDCLNEDELRKVVGAPRLGKALVKGAAATRHPEARQHPGKREHFCVRSAELGITSSPSSLGHAPQLWHRQPCRASMRAVVPRSRKGSVQGARPELHE